jgi:hypothetical protein
MSRQLWLTDEISVSTALRQAVELCRAGFRRPWLTLGLVCGASVALALALLFGRREYAPELVLRVVEAEHRPGTAPPLKRQLAEYVRQAVFTSEPLLELMRRHGLYPSLLRKNPRAALETFKEDISVEVYQNYFLEHRAAGDAPRTARLTVSFHAKDPNLALAVTRDLGSLIVSHELAARSDQALSAAARAARARDTWVVAWQRRSAEIVNKRAEIAAMVPPNPQLQVELVSLLGSLPALEREVETAERRAANLELGAAWERRGIGLNFEMVDEGALPGRAARVRAALWVFGSALLCGLPLVAVTVGAFAPSPRGRA